MFSILAYIVIGMVAGWAASLLVRHDMHPSDWGTLFLLGIGSSVIAGIIINVIMGNGFKLQPGGVIASIAVACLLLWIYTTMHNRSHARAEAARSASGQHREPKGGRKHRTKR